MYDVRTQNNFRYDEVSSALQKSVRRCAWPESLQWFLEAFRSRSHVVASINAPAIAPNIPNSSDPSVSSGIPPATQNLPPSLVPTPQQTNILRRLFIYASEDIGPANPSLIMLLDDILDVDNPQNPYLQEIFPIMMLQVMTLSPKSRIFDWIACVLTHQTYGFDANMPLSSMLDTITYHLLHLEDALSEKDFPRACEWVGRYHFFFASGGGKGSSAKDGFKGNNKIDKKDFEKLKAKFRAPPVVKHFSKPSELFWLPVLGVATKQGTSQEVTTLICRLHHLACRRSGTFSFRYAHGVILFWIHAVWAVCHPDEVIKTWTEEGNHRMIKGVADYPEVLKLCTEYSQKVSAESHPLKIPDWALDKHTAAGSKMGRDIGHFILEGSKLNHMVSELLTQEKYWLDRVIRLYKDLGRLKADFELPPDYYDSLWGSNP